MAEPASSECELLNQNKRRRDGGEVGRGMGEGRIIGICILRAEDSLGKRKMEAEVKGWERRRNFIGVGLHCGL